MCVVCSRCIDNVVHISKEVVGSNCSIRVKSLIQGKLSRWGGLLITQLGILRWFEDPFCPTWLSSSLRSGMWTSLTLGLSSKIMEPTGVIVDVPRLSKSGSRANSVWSLPASPEPWSDRGEAHSPRAGLNLDLRPDLGCRSCGHHFINVLLLVERQWLCRSEGDVLRLLPCSVDAVFRGENAVHSMGDKQAQHHVVVTAPWTNTAWEVRCRPRVQDRGCAGEEVWF